MSLLIATALLAGASATPETVIGRWKTETHNAIVEIARCGPSICGKILTSDALRANPSMKDANNANTALRNRPIQGMQMLSGFKPDKDGVWSSGQVYNAEDTRPIAARSPPSARTS